jgi:hypothetical protein
MFQHRDQIRGIARPPQDRLRVETQMIARAYKRTHRVIMTQSMNGEPAVCMTAQPPTAFGLIPSILQSFLRAEFL